MPSSDHAQHFKWFCCEDEQDHMIVPISYWLTALGLCQGGFTGFILICFFGFFMSVQFNLFLCIFLHFSSDGDDNDYINIYSF